MAELSAPGARNNFFRDEVAEKPDGFAVRSHNREIEFPDTAKKFAVIFRPEQPSSVT
jgi:hypothetical protein